MPITAQGITSSIIQAGPGLQGPTWMQMAGAIGVGVASWALNPANVVLTGVVTGTAGGGSVTGKIFVPPVPLPVSSAMAAAGLVGTLSPQIGTAVGMGIGTSLTASAGYYGVSVGAIGADISKVVYADPASLTQSILQAFYAFNIRGPTASTVSMGLGVGIAAMILKGSGLGVAVGPPAPAPGIGSSRSSLF